MTIRDLWLRLRALVSRGRVEQELDEELAFHIECETRKYIAQGIAPAEAARLARVQFGSTALTADACRDQRGIAFVDQTVRDVTYAARAIVRTPLASLTIIGTVAVGLGLVTVVFTFFNLMYFRADDVRKPGELFEFRAQLNAGAWRPFTQAQCDDLRRGNPAFVDVAARVNDVSVRVDGASSSAMLASPNFFAMLGAAPAYGRTFDVSGIDDRHVIVLSDRGWRRLFGGDPSILGRTTAINGVPMTIVGIMPASFRGLTMLARDAWVPLDAASEIGVPAAGPSALKVEVVGRLRPDFTAQAAEQALMPWLEAQASRDRGPERPFAHLWQADGTSQLNVSQLLTLFLPVGVAFGLVWAVGCANVTGLLLARGFARQREIGVRVALGASRGRIMRQLMTEGFLLSLAASGAAYVTARLLFWGAVAVINATLPPELLDAVRLLSPDLDWRVMVFLLCGAVVSCILISLAPSRQSARVDVVNVMRGHLMNAASPHRSRRWLIGMQVTAASLLLVGSAVLLGASKRVAAAQSGLRTVDTIEITMGRETGRRDIVDALSSMTGVAGVAVSRPSIQSGMLLGTIRNQDALTRPWGSIGVQRVSANYFSLLDLPLTKGRVFQAAGGDDQHTAVVSSMFAERVWPGESPLGRVLTIEVEDREQTVTIVGEVRGPQQLRMPIGLRASSDLYLRADPYEPGASLIARVAGDPAAARRAIADRLTRIDPALGAVTTLRSVEKTMGYIFGLMSSSAVALGAVALLFTLTGLFSTLSYFVEQQGPELGVRVALGARPREIIAAVCSPMTTPVAVGMASGMTMALIIAGVFRASSAAASLQAYGFRLFDPLVYGGTTAIVALACGLACAAPLRRAARVDPALTLRE